MMASRELVPIDNEGRLATGELSMGRTPELVLEEAKRAATALQGVIAAKKNPVKFNGEIYLEFEDWSTIASFYGCTVKLESDRFCSYGDASGWEATSVLIRMDTGAVISRATMMCLNDEDNWGLRAVYEWKDELDANGKKIWDEQRHRYRGKKIQSGMKPVPLFQLRSMAQTRAGSKVCRNVFSRIPVLAGYQPTPAEEIADPQIERDDSDYVDVARNAQAPISGKQRTITQEQARMLVQAWKATHGDVPESQHAWKALMRQRYGVESSLKIPADKFEDAMRAIESSGAKRDGDATRPDAATTPDQKLAFELFGVLGYDPVKQATAIKESNGDWAGLVRKMRQELPEEK